jgi:aspartate racemase
MKRLGLIGGLGPESTVDYYKLIIEKFRERTGDNSYPELIIDSLNVTKGIAFLNAGQHEALADYLVAAVQRLVKAGADFGAIAANTPHIVFNPMAARSPIPFISIVEAACAAVQAQGFRRVGLLGTRFTMTGRFYPELFERVQLQLLTPTSDEIAYIHEKYIGELLVGVFKDSTRDELGKIIRRLITDEQLDVILLAGTELPLILRGVEFPIPMLDTAVIHVEAIVNEILR